MSEARRALIIANSDYQDRTFRGLVSPAHDAEELARVLRDPSIGGFEVAPLLNEKAAVVNQAIEEFFIFSDPKPDDLLLLYFSGHGITDEEGHLYLATADTQLVRQSVRRATTVAAEFIDSTMRRSRSRRQVLVLDCCHSGAFAEGMRVKGEPLPALETHFRGIQGKGRIVLTASTGRQFAFEGSSDTGNEPSAYTRILVKGLETGEADLHGDGHVDLDELHEYLLEQLRTVAPHQTPTKSGYLEGQLYIARVKLMKPAELPQKLREALNSSEVWLRQGAVTELEALLRGEHRGLSLAAEGALIYIRDNDDSLRVRAAAARCLTDTAEQERLAREEAERLQRAEQERLAREETERLRRAEQERFTKEEAERLQRAERERRFREEAEALRRFKEGVSVWAVHSEQERLAREEAAVQRAPSEQQRGDREASLHTRIFVALLAVAVLDRALRIGLSLAIPKIARDLSLTLTAVVPALTAFTFSYAACAAFAGMAVSRFGTRRVLSLGLLLSAAAIAWTAAVRDVETLVAARVLLGCGLSPALPAFCAIFARYDERRRALANAVIAFVSQIPALALPALAGTLLNTIGWRPFTLANAVIAAVLAVAWILADRSAVPVLSVDSATRALRNRTAIGCFAAYFGYSYGATVVFNWLPIVFQLRFHSLARTFAGWTLVTGISALLAGVLSARLIARNREAAQSICKRFVIGGLVGAGLTIGITILCSNNLAIAYIFAIGCCVGLGSAGTSLWTLLQTAAPMGAAATWGGFQALFGSLGGILGSSLTGALFGSLGSSGLLAGVPLLFVTAFAAARLVDAKPILNHQKSAARGSEA